MLKYVFLLIVLLNVSIERSYAQFDYDFRENKSAEKISWLLFQLVPSPAFTHETNQNESRLQFGLKWHITPLNISLNPNKYVSPFQFFRIDPTRRFTGSVELFVQPELLTSSFKYANMSVFGLSSGTRIIMPLTDKGEAISFSLGGKYTYRKSFNADKNYYYSAEAGIYFLGGLVGLQFTKNFDERTKYNFNFYLKYF